MYTVPSVFVCLPPDRSSTPLQLVAALWVGVRQLVLVRVLGRVTTSLQLVAVVGSTVLSPVSTTSLASSLVKYHCSVQ